MLGSNIKYVLRWYQPYCLQLLEKKSNKLFTLMISGHIRYPLTVEGNLTTGYSHYVKGANYHFLLS